MDDIWFCDPKANLDRLILFQSTMQPPSTATPSDSAPEFQYSDHNKENQDETVANILSLLMNDDVSYIDNNATFSRLQSMLPDVSLKKLSESMSSAETATFVTILTNFIKLMLCPEASSMFSSTKLIIDATSEFTKVLFCTFVTSQRTFLPRPLGQLIARLSKIQPKFVVMSIFIPLCGISNYPEMRIFLEPLTNLPADGKVLFLNSMAQSSQTWTDETVSIITELLNSASFTQAQALPKWHEEFLPAVVARHCGEQVEKLHFAKLLIAFLKRTSSSALTETEKVSLRNIVDQNRCFALKHVLIDLIDVHC